MKGKFAALLLVFVLVFLFPAALAAESQIENIEYKGFGIFKLEFTRDCDWYNQAGIALYNADGEKIPCIFLGGEEDDCYLRGETIEDGADYTIDFSLGNTSQNLAVHADTAIKFKVNKNGDITQRADNDRCDLCKNPGHDDDFCPERYDAKKLSANPDELARLFDIDRCDFCGGMGHDDDRCPKR